MHRDSKRGLTEGRKDSAASQRITFQEEFAAETQEGSRSMFRTPEFEYNGEVSASSGVSENQRGRERGARGASRPEVNRSESERSRKHRRYPVIAPWRVRGDA